MRCRYLLYCLLFAVGGGQFCARPALAQSTVLQDRTIFQDRFGKPHDFLGKGVAGTSWDGFVGAGKNQTADRIEIAEGMLNLRSTNGRYQEGWNPLGPLLFKTVTTDFKATVRIADYESLSFNNGGIMARVANDSDAGKGEDWISVDYFPIYGGIYARMADDGRRAEKGSNGQGRNADRFLQLERKGNLFFLRHSQDGKAWQELNGSPFQRSDLVNVPLQVGLFQATYSDKQGQVSFDDFSLELSEPVMQSRLVGPANQAVGLPPSVALQWIPGHEATHHDVYFGASREEVSSATPVSPEGVYQGRFANEMVEHAIQGLDDGHVFYWRVDAITGEKIHAGEVWSFTVYDRRLEDFESLMSKEDLVSKWKLAGDGAIALEKGRGSDSSTSLAFAVADHGQVAATVSFEQPQNWLSSTYNLRSLRVFLRTGAGTQLSRVWLACEGGDWGRQRAEIEYPGDLTALTDQWVPWDVDLRVLLRSNPALRLDHITSLTIGVKGAGKLLVDDLSVEYQLSANPASAHQVDTDANQGIASTAQSAWPRYIDPEQFVDPVGFDQVTVTGGLWRERMDVNRTSSLPHVWSRCESSTKANGEASRRLDNFAKAAGQMKGGFTGTFFNDSDVYKIIEGTANSLQNHPDPDLEAYTDRVIDLIAAAQWDDGYLFTFYSLPKRRPEARWSNVGSMHELYCAGHLIEAAIAYRQATGKRKLLDVASRFADLICDTFGPEGRNDAPGHQEIELALFRLFDLTGERRYLATARFFIDQRGDAGRKQRYGTYSQDHRPFVEQENGVGHSVRAGYLYCAATDIARRERDEAYANALFRVWDNVTNRKMYLTGGIGQPGGPEGFAGDYELGNGCYAETCSGIAFAMWNHRLHLMTGESKYADLIERTFYNNMLSALSVEGDRHYYTNPLETGGRERWPWPGHDCACCPSNLVRVISSIGGYAYSQSENTIRVNQYLDSRAELLMGANTIVLKQETQYPWDGDIQIAVVPEQSAEFEIKLRIPGWARNQPMPGNLYRYIDSPELPIRLEVNGSPVAVEIRDGYVAVRRQWKKNDMIHLVLPMRIRRVIAHPRATADKGRVAIERGPLVYCAEFKDNASDAAQWKVSDATKLKAEWNDKLFGGAVTLAETSAVTDSADVGLRLIPYYLYSNRGRGSMRVWLPRVTDSAN
ncbi:MAG: beta-L-arabinofuranosidase domain-containing protein [Rubripirellula sp.]